MKKISDLFLKKITEEEVELRMANFQMESKKKKRFLAKLKKNNVKMGEFFNTVVDAYLEEKETPKK